MCGFTYPNTNNVQIRTSNRLSEYQIQLNLDKYYNKLKANRETKEKLAQSSKKVNFR